MRRMLYGLLGATIVVACEKSETKAESATHADPALGTSAPIDTTTAFGTNAARDTSRAAALRQATARSVTRPAVVYHATDEQKRLRDLRLEKPKTTVRKVAPRSPATNR